MKHERKKNEYETSGDNVIEHTYSVGEPTQEIIAMTKQLLDLETRYEEQKKITAKLYEEKERAELRLYDRMKDIGIDQFRTTEFGLISCANTLYGKISDMDAASTWLHEHKLFDEIFQYKEKKARINELLKKYIEEGAAIPPGFDYILSKSIRHRSA